MVRGWGKGWVGVGGGGVVGLVGPNGAGKTTALRAISGVIRPDRGHVLLDGIDVTALPAHQRTRMGLCLVPEGRGIFRSLSVEDNLRLYAPPGRRHAAEASERRVA